MIGLQLSLMIQYHSLLLPIPNQHSEVDMLQMCEYGQIMNNMSHDNPIHDQVDMVLWIVYQE